MALAAEDHLAILNLIARYNHAIDLGDMTHRVKARFCRRASGEWRYGRS